MPEDRGVIGDCFQRRANTRGVNAQVNMVQVYYRVKSGALRYGQHHSYRSSPLSTPMTNRELSRFLPVRPGLVWTFLGVLLQRGAAATGRAPRRPPTIAVVPRAGGIYLSDVQHGVLARIKPAGGLNVYWTLSARESAWPVLASSCSPDSPCSTHPVEPPLRRQRWQRA